MLTGYSSSRSNTPISHISQSKRRHLSPHIYLFIYLFNIHLVHKVHKTKRKRKNAIQYMLTYIELYCDVRLCVRLFTDCLTVCILYCVYILMFRSSTYCTDVRLSCHNKRILLLLLLLRLT